LLSSGNLALKLSRGGRRLYGEHFAWSVIGDGYLSLLSQAGVKLG
jgi:hypothetical protein